jgi:YVTN family beta-propeller protein
VRMNPSGVSVNPSTDLVYVANREAKTVSVIDGKTNTVTANIIVGTINCGFFRPLGVSVNPSTNIIYVANFQDNTVSVIDGKTNTVTDTIHGNKLPSCS